MQEYCEGRQLKGVKGTRLLSKEMLTTALSAMVAGTVQTRYQVLGKGQMKEQGGFLVSKSLTLPFSPF